MKFNEIFKYKEIKNTLSDLYESIIYNWDEYNPSVCENEDELEKLGDQLLEKLKEVQEIEEKMSKINVDSYGC